MDEAIFRARGAAAPEKTGEALTGVMSRMSSQHPATSAQD
jgi:hypothetical protein